MNEAPTRCPTCGAELVRDVQGLVESYRCLTDGCKWGALYRIEGMNVFDHVGAVFISREKYETLKFEKGKHLTDYFPDGILVETRNDEIVYLSGDPEDMPH